MEPKDRAGPVESVFMSFQLGERQHLACGCSQHLPGHSRPSHVLSLTLWLSEENEAPVANLPALELPDDWQRRCVVSGWSHQRRPWPSHRCAGVTSVKHIHISSLLEVISQRSSCSFSRKQANTLVHGLIWPCLPILT